jgi:hypothetical protein
MATKEELKQRFEEAFDDTEKKEEAARSLTTQTDAALIAWGDRETVIATGIRIKTMLPGGEDLSVPQALAAGQYAVATGLNPFRGEFYAMVDRKGDLKLIDGYKALTRWAESECPFDVQYRPQPTGPGEAHNIKCIIMRHDRREQLNYYLEKGADFQTAFDLVTTSAVGVVMEDETKWQDGNAKKPPTGWTWKQRAEIRALKNALNRSHGMPTVAELARKSWEVAGILTKPEDWDGADDLKTPEERERYAEMSARNRETQEQWDVMTPEEQAARARDNSRLLYGEDIDDPYGDVIDAVVEESEPHPVEEKKEPEPPPAEEPPPEEEPVEEKPAMTLGEALGTPLHTDTEKLGLKKGDYLVLAVRKDAKDLFEYLTKPSSYNAPTFENTLVQEAAKVILADWDKAREAAMSEEEKEAIEAEVVEMDEGGNPPLF